MDHVCVCLSLPSSVFSAARSRSPTPAFDSKVLGTWHLPSPPSPQCSLMRGWALQRSCP